MSETFSPAVETYVCNKPTQINFKSFVFCHKMSNGEGFILLVYCCEVKVTSAGTKTHIQAEL